MSADVQRWLRRFTDKRADIWAFGMVLHERLPAVFGGDETVTGTLASVVNDAPDPGKLP